MRQVYILEKLETPTFGATWILTMPKGCRLERLILRFTRWPILGARIGNDTKNYVIAHIRGKHLI